MAVTTTSARNGITARSARSRAASACASARRTCRSRTSYSGIQSSSGTNVVYLSHRYIAFVSAPLDLLGRPLHDLRISITDRCNFRCVYCMPKEVFGRDYEFLPRTQLLSFEEIERLARAFVANGVGNLRITAAHPPLPPAAHHPTPILPPT